MALLALFPPTLLATWTLLRVAPFVNNIVSLNRYTTATCLNDFNIGIVPL